MKKKKQVAAVAAVMAYLDMEETSAATQTEGIEEKELGQVTASVVGLNLWGLAGRQAQMQLRGLMQIKSFHGARLR